MMTFALGNVSKNVDYWIHGGQSCTFSPFLSHLSIRFARKTSRHLRGMSHSVRGGKVYRPTQMNSVPEWHHTAQHSTAQHHCLLLSLLLDP
jgi:hypothetical protein